jgi:cell wall-associated NlpC family hydrolase
VTKLSVDDVARIAYQVGFRGQGLTWATAIGMRESGGDPGAYNPNVHTGDQSRGVWQINGLGKLGPERSKMLRDMGYSGDLDELFDPVINARMAYKLSNGGTNFEPWRSASPGWEGPQGFLTKTDLPSASAAAARVSMGKANTQTQWLSGITQAQAGQGSTQTRMVSWLNQQLGKDYVFGAKGPNNFDCSGLVSALYDQFGINMPAYTGALATYGQQVSTDQLQPGDMVFFHGAANAGQPSGDLGHVGVYIGGGQYIQAPHTGAKVQVSSLDPARVQMARRVVDAQGRVITGAGLAPKVSGAVQTVPVGQASLVAPQQVSGFSDMSVDPSTPFKPQFSLPTHDFANVLPGKGSEVALNA